MTISRFLAIFAIFLFSVIGLIAIFKQKKSPPKPPTTVKTSTSALTSLSKEKGNADQFIVEEISLTPTIVTSKSQNVNLVKPNLVQESEVKSSAGLPVGDRVDELFNTSGPKLPIVETITYKSRVDWKKGRPAWLSDYAGHFQTSRHFLARSLNGTKDYFRQEIRDGDQINVLKKELPLQFYLLVDASRCKLWLYYILTDTKTLQLIKTYDVGLGRSDPGKESGSLTPIGKYLLGKNIMIYKPKMMGVYQGQSTEMITIFGTRWIPFGKCIGSCTAAAKGFGIHGTPWRYDDEQVAKDTKVGIGGYESDGCIRLATDDIEEIFAIIITKPAIIDIVNDFNEAQPFENLNY